MSIFSNARQRGRTAGFFAAGLVALLWMSPARADVIITSDTAFSNSDAFAVGGPFSTQTHSASGAGNLFQSSFAFSSGLGAAANSGVSTVTLSGPPNGVQTLSGASVNSGAASGLAFSSGTSFTVGNMTVTPANSLNTEYRYTLIESGFAAASGDSFSDAGVFTSLGSSSGFAFSGISPFNFTGSGILLSGTNIFFETFATGSSVFAGGNTGFATFSLVLTPIPEPGTLTMLGVSVVGLAGLGWMRRRKSAVAA